MAPLRRGVLPIVGVLLLASGLLPAAQGAQQDGERGAAESAAASSGGAESGGEWRRRRPSIHDGTGSCWRGEGRPGGPGGGGAGLRMTAVSPPVTCLHRVARAAALPRLASPCHSPPTCAADRALLLTFKAGITNWAEVQAARQLAGWTPCTPADCTPVCTWGGVQCDPFTGNGDSVTTL